MVFSEKQVILIALKWCDALDKQEIKVYLGIGDVKAAGLLSQLKESKFIEIVKEINSYKLTPLGLKWALYFSDGYEVCYNCAVVDHIKEGILRTY